MKVIIKFARLSFNDIFEPKLIGNSTEPKFSATLICLEPDAEANGHHAKGTRLVVKNASGDKKIVPHGKMQEICEQVLKERFKSIPAKAKNWVYNKADGSTTREEYVDPEGNFWSGFDSETFYISAAKQAKLCKGGKLTVLDQLKEAIEPQDQKIFSGCYVNAIIDVYAYETDGTKGVTASLEAIQLVKAGEPLGMTQIDAKEEFDEEEFEEEDDLM